MNLVQINEHLKEVPLQALMSYANGANPMVPPYMATGELKRREVMQQKQQQSQQAQQGLPTVKDQVEQQAGLMALQAQQQKQAQQQMMQQAQSQPMPVPPEIPQPSEQEEEQPAYAYGGIAKLPVRSDMYEFNSGGIIAFDGTKGSQVPVVEETEEEKKRRIQRLLTQGLPSTQGVAPPPSEAIAASKEEPAGLPTLMGSSEPPKPAPRPGEAEIPGLYDTQALDIVKQRLTPRTLKEIAQSQAEAEKLAGVEGKYGENQIKRFGEEEAQYKQMLQDRNFNRMLAVLGGIAQGGLGGAGPAYLQTQAAEQAADIAQKRRMNELYGNVEAKQRDEAIAKAKGITTPYEAGYTQAGDLAGKMASSIMSSQTEFAKEAINNKNALDRLDIQYKRDLEAARLRVASEKELREIENNYALKRDEINKKAQFDLEKYRRTSPTDEQRNFESYLARWKKVPANKNKSEVDAFAQFWMDRQGGQFKEGRQDLIGLHNLQVNYAKQLEDLTLPKEKRAEIQRKLDAVNAEIEARVRAGNTNPSSTNAPSVSNW